MTHGGALHKHYETNFKGNAWLVEMIMVFLRHAFYNVVYDGLLKSAIFSFPPM